MGLSCKNVKAAMYHLIGVEFISHFGEDLVIKKLNAVTVVRNMESLLEED